MDPSLELIKVMCFVKLTADQLLVFIGLRIHARLTCWKTGPGCLEVG